MLAIELSKEAEARLAAMAEEAGLAIGDCAAVAVLAWMEYREDVAMAKEAYLGFKASGAKAVPMAEVERRFGLGD